MELFLYCIASAQISTFLSDNMLCQHLRKTLTEGGRLAMLG
jgi:hypothetical protein